MQKIEYFAGKEWVFEKQENGSWYCDQDMTEKEWEAFCDLTKKRLEDRQREYMKRKRGPFVR